MTDTLNLMKLDSKIWHNQIAKLLIAQNTPDFTKVMLETLKCVVTFDHSVIFAFHGRERPHCLFETFTPRQRIVMVADYQEGPYLLDPFFIACQEQHKPGLYRLREIAPDRFYYSEYYRSYYRRTGLSEEIAFILELPDNVVITISLMRAAASPCFSERDMAKLRRMEAIIYACATQHWLGLGNEHSKSAITDNTQAGTIDLHIASAFKNFGKSTLTPREREIVAMVLRGHSSNSIGYRCGIASGTVKIHRKNIYSKLEISSQSELFSLFISYLSSEIPEIGFPIENREFSISAG